MKTRIMSALMIVSFGLSTAALGQFPQDDPETGTQVQRWRFGMVVTAVGGPCRALVGSTTVPIDWPEQQVKIVEQDVSRGAKVSYKTIDGTVKQMVVKIPYLAAGAQARAVITYEIKRSQQLPPQQTDAFTLPDPKKLDRKLRGYLLPSPYIDSTHSSIKALAGQIGADRQTAWERVEAIYDWVREKVEYRKDTPPKSSLQALADGFGDCDELTSVFIAICRAGNIPARTVRLPTHCYPEFYLLDDQGRGRWFPCEAAGSPAFGRVLQHKPILQKGDNFRIRVRDPRTRRLVVKQFRFPPSDLSYLPGSAGARPEFKLVCEPAQ